MRALILCAGKGTRLGKLTKDTPKVMLKVGNKPVLEHLVDHLNSFGITEIIVNLHHKPEKIYKYFGTRLLYFYEPKLLGAEKTELELASGYWLAPSYEDCSYIVLNGDTLTDIDINLMTKDYSSVDSYDNGVYTGAKYVSFGKPRKKNFHCYWQDIGTPEGLKKAREYYEKFGNLPKLRKQGN